MVPDPWKIDLWSGLGAHWAPSCRQDGTRSTPRAKHNEKNEVVTSSRFVRQSRDLQNGNL